MSEMMPAIAMFGLQIATASFSEAVAALEQVLKQDDDQARLVVTPNTDQIIKLQRNTGLLRQYRSADFIFPDGFPLVLTSRLLYGWRGCQKRVTGADLFPALCRSVDKMGGKIFLLGGRPGQEAFLRKKMMQKYPSATCEVFSPAMDFQANSADGRKAADRINRFRPDLTFVCLGMPKQERWALQYRATLATRLICCFGAAFEFDLGLVKRAPQLLQKIGLEWLWRLLINPRTMARRYLIDAPYFLILLVREILQHSRRKRDAPKV